MLIRYFPILSGLALGMAPRTFAGNSSQQVIKSAEQPALPSAGRDHFRISAGWMYRQVGDVQFSSGSRSQFLSLPSLFRASSIMDPAVGPAGSPANRRYADGFVEMDPGTLNDGNTSRWGYEDASQVDGDSIRYRAIGSRDSVERDQQAQPGTEWNGDEGGNAPVIELGWSRDVTPQISVGALLQWSLLQLDGDDQGTDFSAWQQLNSSTRTYTDVYDLHGIIPPEAPYAGSGLGFGPLLDAVPARREIHDSPNRSARALYRNELSQALDIDVNTISLGPTVAFAPGRLAFEASAGLALNIASWDAEQHEALRLSRNGRAAQTVHKWHDHASATDVLPGFYLQSAVRCQFTPRLSLSAFGRYEWSQELTGEVGPSSFQVDLSGWSAGVLVGVQF